VTAADHTSERSSTRAARAAAIVTWIYAAGFGLSTVPVSIYLLKRGSLPSFLGLFDMYGGPWSSSRRVECRRCGRSSMSPAVRVASRSASGRWSSPAR
jgi:hypothetical protein